MEILRKVNYSGDAKNCQNNNLLKRKDLKKRWNELFITNKVKERK
jgi:hypothetical protein